MKTKVYFLSVLCSLFVLGASAQCPGGGRYTTEIFSGYTVSTVTYSTPYGLQMDIYQPTGDTLSARPLIILAHGGSFTGGTRTDDGPVDTLCQRFAKRGYVTASIDYRLLDATSLGGADSLLAISQGDTAEMINEVVEAISDGKAAIRFFTKDAATTNTYKIDTNNIFIGGNSAGAVLFMQVGYIDSLGAAPADLQAIINANGGFEGNSGNAGYTTKYKAVINLAGALNIPQFIGPGSVPSFNAQGNQDATVPFDCGYPNIGITIDVRLCGLGALQSYYDANHVYTSSIVYPGQGHVPWQTNQTMMNQIDSATTAFLYSLVCSGASGIPSINDADISLFPNPANTVLNMHSSEPVQKLAIYDELGRVVYNNEAIGNLQYYQVNTADFAKGLYLLKIYTTGSTAPALKKIVVE